MPKVGGGTSEVEVIKIATANGGGDSSTLPYRWGGGGTLLEQKTLSQLVGDKRIVGITAEGKYKRTSTDPDTPISLEVSIEWNDSHGVKGNLITNQDAFKASEYSLGFNAYVASPVALSNPSIDIYAICI